MAFNKICIIGTGLIGGSLALAFRRKHVGEQIIGVDFKDVAENAKSQGIVDDAFSSEDIEIAVADADLVILATNIYHILNTLPKIAKYAKTNTLVTDVGSTKSQIVETANREFGKDAFFLGGHPMAGSEKHGISAADSFLFENCFYILTPLENTPQEMTTVFANLLEQIGAKVLILNAALHDQIAAAVSHLPQLLAVHLVNFIARYNQQEPNYLKLAAGGFRDMTRIAASPFEMWEDICTTNKDNISRLLDNFIETLTIFRNEFQSGNIETLFDSAAKTRLSIPKDTKGFIHPNFDVSVVVEDKPGVIAKIANTLAAHQINIRDIEVLKVRLLEGGTIRLSFESEKSRTEAIQLLKDAGFDCRKI